jgi:hypothetical protein
MRTLFTLIGLPLGLALLLPAGPSAAQDKNGWTPLFNGKDLTGWKPTLRQPKEGKPVDPKDVWSVVDGYIRCIGKPNGYIATEKEYGDYVLRVKWRFPKDSKGGNSGVLLHVQKEDKVWPDSVEAQLASGRAGDFWLIMPPQTRLEIDPARLDPNNKEKRHFFRIPKDEVIEKPFGEWNQYEITCQGGDVTLVVNGIKANEGRNGNLTRGRIALQSEGTEVHFKDIEIKMLK